MNSTPAPDGLYCPNAHFKIIKVGQKIIKNFFKEYTKKRTNKHKGIQMLNWEAE
jgi:hypothetical protein